MTRKNSPAIPIAVSNPEPAPRLLRVADSARYLGCTVWFLRSLAWARKIPFVRLGKRLLFDKKDLDNYADSQKEQVA
jgi:excisionase family DNA binding protein